MTLVIEKWYNRILIFLLLNFLVLFLCLAFEFFKYELAFLTWLLVPLLDIVVIAKTIQQRIMQMGILRFLLTFIVIFTISGLFWALMWFGFVKMHSYVLPLEWGYVLFFVVPMMTLWTTACFMLLALWPFSAIRNVEPSR